MPTNETLGFEHLVTEGQYQSLTEFKSLTFANTEAVNKNWGVDNGYGSDNGYFYTARNSNTVAASAEVSPGHTDMIISSDNEFQLHYGYFSAVWQSEDVTISGYKDGVLIKSRVFHLDKTPTKIVFGHNFDHIDTLEITAAPASGDNSNVAIDHLRVTLSDPSSGAPQPTHSDSTAHADVSAHQDSHTLLSSVSSHLGADWFL